MMEGTQGSKSQENTEKAEDPRWLKYMPCNTKRVRSGKNDDERKDILTEAINYHFSSHWKKLWHKKKRRLPFKAAYHVILIVLVIIQVSGSLYIALRLV